MSSALAIFTTIMVVLFARPLMGAFTSDPAVISIGSHYLVIIGAFYVLFSTMFVVGGVMRGAGDTLIPMFITLFALWIIRIPLAWIFSRHMGYIGIWWSIPIAWFIGMSLSYLYYLKGNWKRKVIVRHAPPLPIPEEMTIE